MIQSLFAMLCLLLLATESAIAFSFGVPRGRITTRRLRSATFHLSMSSKDDDNGDYDGSATIVEQEEAMDVFGAFLEPNTNRTTLLSNMETPPELMFWTQLLSIASRTGRGEFATASDKEHALGLVKTLEGQNPTLSPTNSSLVWGTWELVYSSTQLFRSSPFFMAGRAVCADEHQAQQYNWFCDMHRQALAISNIGAVRQVVSVNRLISEFQVKVGAVPFVDLGTKWPFRYSGGLPLTIDGAIVSSADITCTHNASAWEVYMDTVEIKGSNVPGIRQVLDGGLQLSSRKLSSLLESTVLSYKTPKPIFTTTFLDNEFRISRDQDENVFVYVKVSNDTSPTDYSGVLPDLGVSKLLEGFNDAVTKFYL